MEGKANKSLLLLCNDLFQTFKQPHDIGIVHPSFSGGNIEAQRKWQKMEAQVTNIKNNIQCLDPHLCGLKLYVFLEGWHFYDPKMPLSFTGNFLWSDICHVRLV